MRRSALGYWLFGLLGTIVLIALAVGGMLGRIGGNADGATMSAECRKKVSAELYREAVAFEEQKNLGSAVVRFSSLCNGGYYWPTEPLESPCDASARLSRQISGAYQETMAALSDYRARNGKYPDSLEEILHRLPPDARLVVAHFSYCKKANPTDRTWKCSDGAISFADSEVAIGTGQYGSVSFDLHEQSRTMPRSCAKSRAP